MGWERGRYYTRTRRSCGRRVREYIGSGPAGRRASQADAMRRRRAAKLRVADASMRAEASSLDALVSDAVSLVDVALRASLLVSGYRLRRGEIRGAGPNRD